MQWTISLCRFDIANAVMALSCYRAAPRIGHLDRASAFVATFASIRMVPFDSVRAFLVMLSKLTRFRNMIGFTLSTGILLRRFHQVCLFQKGNLFDLLLLLMQI